jgi:hypothetical protein
MCNWQFPVGPVRLPILLLFKADAKFPIMPIENSTTHSR